MAKRQDISAEYARQLLDYNPETGIMKWKYRPPTLFTAGEGRYTAESQAKTWNKRWAGVVAGRPNAKGYLLLGIGHRDYRVHHLAWLIMTGEWPNDQIDHRDGDTGNNSFANLREATGAENQQNHKKHKNNTSGYPGVSWHGQTPKWTAYISVNKHRYHLGMFNTAKEAHAAYLVAKAKYHPFQPTQRS